VRSGESLTFFLRPNRNTLPQAPSRPFLGLWQPRTIGCDTSQILENVTGSRRAAEPWSQSLVLPPLSLWNASMSKHGLTGTGNEKCLRGTRPRGRFDDVVDVSRPLTQDVRHPSTTNVARSRAIATIATRP